MIEAKLKDLPPLLTDEEAETFSDEADLSEYDLSSFRPMRFELQRKESRLNMRLPDDQLAALKAMARGMGIPYTRLARQFIEAGLQAAKR
jgi:predicted DNA binding CopG/RHH family protein